MKKEDIIGTIEKMTVLELSELVRALEEKFGVSAAMPMAMAVMPAQASSGETEVGEKEEKTSFTVVLTEGGNQKIQVIKALRELTTLGLKEAKDLVDGVPKTVKEGVSKEEAGEMKKKLEEAGAKVEIK